MRKHLSFLAAILCLVFAFGLNTNAATYKNFTYTIKNGGVVITDFTDLDATSVSIPSTIDGKKVTEIGSHKHDEFDIQIGAFQDHYNLKSIIIPNTVNTIGKDAFAECWDFTDITLPNSVKTIGEEAFIQCRSIKSIAIPNGVSKIAHNTFLNCTALKSITIPSSVKSIDDDAFKWCNALTSITIPKSVTSLSSECGLGYGWYEKADGDIADCKVSGFTIKGYDYSEAETYAKNNGFKFVSLTKRVTSVTITGSTHTVLAGKTLQLKATVSPNDADNKNVKWTSSNNSVATVSQSGLVTVKSGTGGKSVTIKATAQDRSGKSDSWSISSKNVSSANTVKINSIKKVGQNIYVVTSASTVRYKAPVSKKITSIKIPKSVKIKGRSYKVTAIAKKAFFNCKNLKKVTIKSPIKKIGKYAFYKCKKLKTIRIYSTKLTKNSILTGAFKGISKKAVFYLPKGKKAAYKKILMKRGAKKTMKFRTN